MGIMDGLKAAKQLEERASAGGGGNEDYVKVDYLKINDGQTVRLRFLQEIDSDSDSFNEKAGNAIFAIEHTPQEPFNFKRKFLCTMEDEGQCWGCEMAQQNSKWKAKPRFYANVLVDDKVYVLSQGFSDKSVTPHVISYAEEAGGITKAIWKVSRKGSAVNNTSYTAVPLPTADEVDVESYELFDLRKGVIRDIPFDRQQAYVSGGTEVVETTEAPEPASDLEMPDW